ncbi:MAG: UDP-2,3-diacylglucosamine diphosphatase, partial [Cellvibrio sp.]
YSLKADDIMHLSPAEVLPQMESAGVTRMIHGHTHRPARHQLVIAGKPAERIVLGDWHEAGWCIEADQNSIELIDWKI